MKEIIAPRLADITVYSNRGSGQRGTGALEHDFCPHRCKACGRSVKHAINSSGKLRRIFAANISLLLSLADSSHGRNALTYFRERSYCQRAECSIRDVSSICYHCTLEGIFRHKFKYRTIVIHQFSLLPRYRRGHLLVHPLGRRAFAGKEQRTVVLTGLVVAGSGGTWVSTVGARRHGISADIQILLGGKGIVVSPISKGPVLLFGLIVWSAGTRPVAREGKQRKRFASTDRYRSTDRTGYCGSGPWNSHHPCSPVLRRIESDSICAIDFSCKRRSRWSRVAQLRYSVVVRELHDPEREWASRLRGYQSFCQWGNPSTPSEAKATSGRRRRGVQNGDVRSLHQRHRFELRSGLLPLIVWWTCLQSQCSVTSFIIIVNERLCCRRQGRDFLCLSLSKATTFPEIVTVLASVLQQFGRCPTYV